MLYRIKQFWHALFPRIRSWEQAYLKQHIPPEALPLFFRQSAADQRHALDVALQLKSWNLPLSQVEYRVLQLAALFHDCGKTQKGIKLWQRVAIVVLERAPQRIRLSAEQSRSFSLALQIAAMHADWGSEAAGKAGLPPVVCALIRDHHRPNSNLGRLLQKADNRN